jgi:hypothetical protein
MRTKFGTEFYKWLSEGIGIILFTVCYSGKDLFGNYFKFVISSGLAAVILSIGVMCYQEFRINK